MYLVVPSREVMVWIIDKLLWLFGPAFVDIFKDRQPFEGF